MDQIQEFLDNLKETFSETWEQIVEQFPVLENLSGNGHLIASGVAIAGALICVITTLGTNKSAASLESAAATYKAGQAQLNSVLGNSVDVGFNDEDTTILGRAELALQYKELTSLPSDANITKMKKNLGLGVDEIEEENENYDTAMSDKIRAFAGDYGGALGIPGTIGTSSLKLAAYSDSASMTAHDSTEGAVSNVLYEKIRRTIDSPDYGVAAAKNTLIFLSAANVNGISSVNTGSTLYTLFGDSDKTGNKDTNKYICTGKASGTYAISDSVDGEEETEDLQETDLTDIQNDEHIEEFDTTASVAVLKTDVTRVDITGDDVVDGERSYNSDGTVNKDYNADETVNSSDSNDNSGADSSSSTGSSSGSSSYNADDGLPTSSKNAVTAVNVLDENGDPLTDNTTADLILYEYNKSTGKVTITYWNVAGSDAANKALTSSSVTMDDESVVETTTADDTESTDNTEE